MRYTSDNKFFSGTSVSDFFDQKRQAIMNEINSKSQNELLNISIEKYSEYLAASNQIEFPVIFDTEYTISSYEGDIPASWFPPDFGIFDRSGSIKRDVIVFHVPYSGDSNYLKYRPSSLHLSGTPSVRDVRNEFQFEYIKFYDDKTQIEKKFANDLRSFKSSYETLKADFDNFNNGLKEFTTRGINNRRDTLLAKNNFLNSFKVPLKSSESAPKTFTIPSPKLRDKIVITRPITSNSNFVPEPTLDYTNYQKILKIIDDVGKNFERMPSVYKNKEEEHLRDHIVMVLDPNFEYGSATGETFNSTGKTDILLRYDSSVVFIAECKFWGGEKGFQKTIDQLLGYLTWRDSKTALVIFVQNKEIIPILSKINTCTTEHPCYLSAKGKKAENWSEFVFHLPNDTNKEITLSVLVFHLPKE